MTALGSLSDLIRQGRTVSDPAIKETVQAVFGERYSVQAGKEVQVRNAYALAREDAEGGVPWAGLINPDNPPSGPYGGTSLVWFPGETTSLIGLGVGTRGISPDEGILTRPGHRRRVASLRRMLAQRGIEIWSKADPSALNIAVPKSFSSRLPDFGSTFKRYANEMYCVALVPSEPTAALGVVQNFFDLYAYERGWAPLSAFKEEANSFLATLRSAYFEVPTVESISDLVRARRFVILQGAPGTGKTRLAEFVKRRGFENHGMTIQFHPSVTYEDFVVGLSPNPSTSDLQFMVRPGAMLDAASRAAGKEFLLVVDEINRADLGKVLGEAIYLFEPNEVGGAMAREVRLPHKVNGESTFKLPVGLFVLGTMNTADRSIASVDIAIRRRFAFVRVPPDRTAIERESIPDALTYFDELADLFMEHASEESFDLLPGQAYFLAKTPAQLKSRVKHELIPLLEDYLHQGLLGSASNELQAVRDRFQDLVA